MRMQLTDEEAKIILRMREVEDAHRGGWNKAMAFVAEYYKAREGGTELPNLIAENAVKWMKK